MVNITDIKNKDPELNAILKEMWRIDAKLIEGEVLAEEEQAFYNQNLNIIKEYYVKSSEYWNLK